MLGGEPTSHPAKLPASATVALRPTRRCSGPHRRNRASASAKRSPRFVGASACASSMMTTRRSSKNTRACSEAISKHSCSGVVSKISGGCARWRVRLCAGRVAGAGLDAQVEVHLAHRRFEIAGDVSGQGFEGRDVERVEPVRPACAFKRARRQIDQARQKTRKRFAGARWCDQQCRQALRRALHQLKLMCACTPAAAGEPCLEGRRQGWNCDVHAWIVGEPCDVWGWRDVGSDRGV